LVAYVVARAAIPENGARPYRLPNGLMIAHLNKNETDYLFKEIFEGKEYLRNGIALPDGACVFDVGANIGMFTLFVSENCPGARIYSFEPLPPIYEVLNTNSESCKASVKTFACGLSDHEGVEDFTYYERGSMMSSLAHYSNRGEEIELVRRFIENEGVEGSQGLLQHGTELLEARFQSQMHRCMVRRLSDFIDEEGIERIDLLKIDVQRAEIDVLAGIDADDWKKIRQIVIEAHDSVEGQGDGRVRRIIDVLSSHGFEVKAEQDHSLKDTGLFNLYAVRPENASSIAAAAPNDLKRAAGPPTAQNLREALRGSLPEYMIPSHIELLPNFPVLPNGKVNRKALPKPGQTREAASTSYIAPQTPAEIKIAGLWSEVLKVERVGIDDNFFELGGHSFLAIRIHHRLCRMFDREIPLLKLFELTTVRKVAALLEVEAAAAPPNAAPAKVEEQWASGRKDALRRQRALAEKASEL
jgi:FkbM family methyltransferase